ncbi:MAG TPA: glutamine--tRNA ligase/YqeY domain fusion protein, partial [Anaerolineae bacterium]|nr:glutamine--tRNA ligase/YqeY domain fusion protein [Anaerolineae bacterium]
YLHIGHAKAICIDFGIAQEFGGKCNLRFDDTNPTKEDVEYVDAIKEDIHWLGFDWAEREFYASDYFEQLYELAIKLIKKGKAYVDDQSADEVRQNRGTLTEQGSESPYRNRSIEENLDLFQRMKNGEFPDGSRLLRAKIDMASGNINLRDPAMYRIIHAPAHHRTGSQWCIYPMYDFAHGQSDSIEGVTHSLCSLEYEAHRPLYDWFLKELEIFAPRQIEFARLNMNYTVMSKRKLLRLVQEGFVKGWDDPRMPTLGGLRRRGYTPEAIRDFANRIGVAKADSVIDVALLEACLRDDLNKRAPRVLGVLRPLKLVIDNYPDDQVEEFEVANGPADQALGTRRLNFSKTLYIEQEDFQEVPAPKYYRLFPGNEVRLRYAYIIKCVSVIKNERDEVIEVHCTYDPASRGGDAPDGRKIKSTIHWVSAAHAINAEVRLYDRLFNRPDPEAGEGFINYLNPNSLTVLSGCKVEGNLANTQPGDRFQFERQGYFCTDLDSTADKIVFNLAVPLRDTWAKIEQKQK